MRYVLTEEEQKLIEIIKPYAVYPPVNGYHIRPDAPKEVFDALERLLQIQKETRENLEP